MQTHPHAVSPQQRQSLSTSDSQLPPSFAAHAGLPPLATGGFPPLPASPSPVPYIQPSLPPPLPSGPPQPCPIVPGSAPIPAPLEYKDTAAMPPEADGSLFLSTSLSFGGLPVLSHLTPSSPEAPVLPLPHKAGGSPPPPLPPRLIHPSVPHRLPYPANGLGAPALPLPTLNGRGLPAPASSKTSFSGPPPVQPRIIRKPIPPAVLACTSTFVDLTCL